MKKLITGFTLLALLSACGGENNTSEVGAAPAPEQKPSCTYSYNPSATELVWVAYKFSERTGVRGQFDAFNITGSSASSQPQGVLEGAQFEITTASSNSGDPTRDPKILEHFYGSLSGSDKITGNVVSVTGSDTAGNVVFMLTLNGQQREVTGKYAVNGDLLEVEASLQLGNWGAEEAINNLNKVCEDLHKGADGVSKLWPDVSVFISTKLEKDCPEA